MKRSPGQTLFLAGLLQIILATWAPSAVLAVDSDVTRATLSGLPGVHVIVEELNPNVLKYEKYLKKVDLSREGMRNDVEKWLQRSGIPILTNDEWLSFPGRPALCVTVNTHENEKFWFAYDVRVELRQIVFIETNPQVRTWAPTWSVNMTGLASIGTLNLIKEATGVLVDRFISAYKEANRKRP